MQLSANIDSLFKVVAELRAMNQEQQGFVPGELIEALEHLATEMKGHAVRKSNQSESKE